MYSFIHLSFIPAHWIDPITFTPRDYVLEAKHFPEQHTGINIRYLVYNRTQQKTDNTHTHPTTHIWDNIHPASTSIHSHPSFSSVFISTHNHHNHTMLISTLILFLFHLILWLSTWAPGWLGDQRGEAGGDCAGRRIQHGSGCKIRWDIDILSFSNFNLHPLSLFISTHINSCLWPVLFSSLLSS